MREGIGVKWLAAARHDEGHVPYRRGVQHRLQFQVQWDCERLAGLALANMEPPIAKVLASQLHYISPALCCVQEEGEG
jgi:hypothetical protein